MHLASGKSQQQQSNGGDIVAHIPDGKNHFVAPQMWTRNDIVEFKELLSKETESIINVGSGELVTVGILVHLIDPSEYLLNNNKY